MRENPQKCKKKKGVVNASEKQWALGRENPRRRHRDAIWLAARLNVPSLQTFRVAVVFY